LVHPQLSSPRWGERIVATPRPSPLPAGEGIKGRGKEGEKRKNDFHVCGAQKGHECLYGRNIDCFVVTALAMTIKRSHE